MMSDSPGQGPQIDGYSDPLDSFRGSRGGWKDGLLWGCGGLVFAGLVAVVGSLLVWLKASPETRILQFVAVACFTLLFVLLGIWGLVRAVLIGRRVLWVYPEGLVRSGFFSATAFLWKDVDELVEWPGLGTVLLLLRDGRRLSFYSDDVENAPRFSKLVRKRICKALVSGFVKRIRGGETVECGRLQANEEGVTLRRGEYRSKKTPSFYSGPLPVGPDELVGEARTCPKHKTKDFYPWDQLIGWEVDEAENQVYLITPDGPDATGSTPRDVPNVAVLVEIGRALKGK